MLTKEQKIKEVRLILAHVKENKLDTRSRIKELVEPRSYLYYYMREIVGLTCSEIGSIFDLDHSTVSHGTKTARNLLKNKDLLYLKRCRLEIDKFPLDKYEQVKLKDDFIVKNVILSSKSCRKLASYSAARGIKNDDTALNQILTNLRV